MSFGTTIRGFDAVHDLLEYNEFGTVKYRAKAEKDYAVFVEFGTIHMQAQPYVRPAVRRAIRDMDVIVQEADGFEDIPEIMANRIAEDMRDTVPVDTGALQDSIEVEEV